MYRLPHEWYIATDNPDVTLYMNYIQFNNAHNFVFGLFRLGKKKWSSDVEMRANHYEGVCFENRNFIFTHSVESICMRATRSPHRAVIPSEFIS